MSVSGATRRSRVSRKIGMRSNFRLPFVAVPWLLWVAIAALSVLGTRAVFQPGVLPVSHVRVVGEFQRLDPKEVQHVVMSRLSGNLLTVNIKELRDTLSTDAWVRDVSIRRIWPDGLLLTIGEEQPIARWGKKGFLSAEGRYYTLPDATVLEQELPLLDGPDGSQSRVLKYFHEFNAVLQGIGESVHALHMNELHAWTLELNNGWVVRLGRQHVSDKVKRLTSIAYGALQGRADEVDAVDMRYAHGYAVVWKKEAGQIPSAPALKKS